MKKHATRVCLEGHILDSLTLSKVLDEIQEMGGSYDQEELIIGRSQADTSKATFTVTAPSANKLRQITRRLEILGVVEIRENNISLQKSPKNGVFPEGFYATTNYPTEVQLEDSWIKVKPMRMDCGIQVDPVKKRAMCVKMNAVEKGTYFVVGHEGVRVIQAESEEKKTEFNFMNSAVSAEKPHGALLRKIAETMGQSAEKGKTVLVCGPAIVHTGAGPLLERLIRNKWVHQLFAGNALAAHDIEQSFFGTSLGVSIESGAIQPAGHQNHLRAINRIRAAGSIKNAVKKGILKSGIMQSCVVSGCDYLLAGSIRDDGPLPEVITDMIEAQKKMMSRLNGAKLVIMLSTMLHSIAVGNLLPADVTTVCVDISPAVVTKLTDRGTHQAIGIVMDVEAFLRELLEALEEVS